MASYFEKILKEKKIAYAIFDSDFFLKKFSVNFSKIIHSDINTSNSLWEIFPELFGSENEIQAILSKNRNRYQLDKVNKYTDTGDIRYYDLTILPLIDGEQHRGSLLCIVADTTDVTSLQQEIRQQRFEIELLKASLSSYGNYACGTLLGESAKIKQLYDFINKIAGIKTTTVLLHGESGTGKNLVARIIHQISMPPNSPFVEINCASIPATLLESEIFGYEKGAFTNAFSSKKGLLEEADNGTLFLDEIGELPLSLQSKFLSVLENKTYRRLGSTLEKRVDVRIIAATNKDLREAVEKNEFRSDLFFRINVVNMKLPPLRELGVDILIIAEHFIHLYAIDFGKKAKGLTEGAKAKLLNYSWPGNVRELRNVIERAVIFTEDDVIDSDDLILEEKKQLDMTQFVHIPDEGISMFEVEKNLLLEALSKTKGNQSHAAKLLGLTLDTFRYRIKKYDLAGQYVVQ